MPDFRYAQFCSLARAAEIVGHRWVLLILRELFIGPQRFSDLRRRLAGVSPSVLTERLALLEAAAVIARRELPPPAATTVYELTARGRALEPALLALARWGARLMGPPQPGDHVEPEWLRMGAAAFARREPTPARRFELVVVDGAREAVVRCAGGPQGTRLLEDAGAPVDARVRAPVAVVLGLMSGLLAPAQALAHPDVRVEGDREALADLPRLFDMDLEVPTPNPKGANP